MDGRDAVLGIGPERESSIPERRQVERDAPPVVGKLDDPQDGPAENLLEFGDLLLAAATVDLQYPTRRSGRIVESREAGTDYLRRTAALLILAFGLLWLLRGPESMHVQLRRLFEFATVKCYVEPLTLHLLGLLTIPLAAMPLLAFLAVGGVLRRRPRWTFGSIIAAAATAMLWWGVSPAAVPGSVARFAGATQGSATPTALVVFPLICGTAAGFQRLCTACHTRRGRAAVWLCVLVLLAADLYPYARTALVPAVDRRGLPSAVAADSVVSLMRGRMRPGFTDGLSERFGHHLGAHLPLLSGLVFAAPGYPGETGPFKESRKTPFFS